MFLGAMRFFFQKSKLFLRNKKHISKIKISFFNQIPKLIVTMDNNDIVLFPVVFGKDHLNRCIFLCSFKLNSKILKFTYLAAATTIRFSNLFYFEIKVFLFLAF